MKTIFICFFLSITAFTFAQKDVNTTRLTHLLTEPNQATFNDTLTVNAGTRLALTEYNHVTQYYKTEYNSKEYFVYYPYFNEVADIKVVQAGIKQSYDHGTDYSVGRTSEGHIIFTGPRGGRYYINKNGNKTYIKND